MKDEGEQRTTIGKYLIREESKSRGVLYNYAEVPKRMCPRKSTRENLQVPFLDSCSLYKL